MALAPRREEQQRWPQGHIDCATGEASIVEYRDGYRLPPGAVSEYNPLDGLRRPEDE
jgi:hypothetical protein